MHCAPQRIALPLHRNRLKSRHALIAFDGRKLVVLVVSILAITGSVISLFITECERSPKPNLEPHLALGQVMAEETVKLLDHRGEVVVVTRQQAPEFKNPALEARLKAFRETLSQKGDITVLTTQTPKISRDPMMESQIEEFPSAVLFSILEEHPRVSAIVSFTGAPLLTEEEIAGWGKKMPKIVVFSSFGTGLKECFEKEIVQVAIISRRYAKPNALGKPRTPREWFDQHYEVVTP